jgi:NAD(P)H-flavin reductase
MFMENSRESLLARVAKNDPMRPVPHRIRKRQRETHDIFTLELEPIGVVPTAFQPGQFNMLYAFGTGEVAISISGDPALANSVTHTIRSVGTVTNVLNGLKRGDMVGVRGPFGNPWPLAEATGKDVVIVAGGVGLAPLRSVVYRILAQRDKYARVVLLYGARTPDDLLYQRELEDWRSRFDLDVDVTLDTATSEWRGKVGVVTTLIARAAFDPLDSIVLMCGPEVMMRFTIQELEKRGVHADQIYVSLERNMKCAVGFCGHCQYGPTFVCKDGPVFRFDRIQSLFKVREM